MGKIYIGWGVLVIDRGAFTLSNSGKISKALRESVSMKVIIAKTSFGSGEVTEPLAEGVTAVKRVPSHEALPSRSGEIPKSRTKGVPVKPVKPNVHSFPVDNVGRHPLMNGDALVDRDAALVNEQLGEIYFLCQGRVEPGRVHVIQAALGYLLVRSGGVFSTCVVCVCVCLSWIRC